MADELEEQEADILVASSSSSINITFYFNYEPRFNGAFLRNNLSRIRDGVYVINLDDKKSKGKHWVSLFTDWNTLILLEFNIFLKKY